MVIIPFLRGISRAYAERESQGVYVKYSSDPKQWAFLNEQAMYMADCGHPFVEILGIAHGRYWMKEYDAPVLTMDSLKAAKASLRPLWGYGDEKRYVDRNWGEAHTRRVVELCEMNDIRSLTQPILEMFEARVWKLANRLTVCAATHGDATLSNTLSGQDREVRWIDPIPPSLWLPAFKAVDLGKLLQSAYGWEWFLNNQTTIEPQANAVLQDESVEDMMAASYFHMLCYVRILRYATDKPDVHDYAMRRLNEFLSR